MSGSAVTLADITSASWSLMLDVTAGRGAGSGTGRVVQGLDDVDQCVGIILGTTPGEDPFRPMFGCDLTKFIDQPLAAVLPAIVGTVTQAIRQWEPRVEVLSVTATPIGAALPGSIRVSVQWQIAIASASASGAIRIGAASLQTTTVTVG